ncbi:MAG: Hsp20/alpha crystallin family protein [Nitrospiria bacterium]
MVKEKSESTEIKTTTPSKPLGSTNLFEKEMNRIFQDFWKGPWFDFGWPKELLSRIGNFGFQTPKIEIYEDKNNVVVKAELPGMKNGDVEVNLQGNILTIRGEKKTEEEEKKKGYYYSECSYGAFERSVEIPQKVLPDKTTASFKDGILEIRLEKTEEAKQKEIKIKVE